MSKLKAEYLEAIRRAVQHDLLPELHTAMARHRAELIDMVLARLIVTESGLPSLLRDHWKAQANQLNAMIPQLPREHPAGAALLALVGAALQAPAEDELISNWDESLASAMQTVLGLLEQDSGQSLADRDTFIAGLATAEDEFRGLYEDQVATVLALNPADDSNGDDDLAVTAEALSAYLAERFPDRHGIYARNVVKIPGGRSKATIMFDLVSDSEPAQQLVMRKDFPVNFLETRVVDEFPVLDILAGLDAPVARPLWVESESRYFGTPFMVSEKVAGKTAGNLFTVAEASEAAGLELARVLAFFHSLDLDATGIAAHVAFGTSSKAVHDLVDFWYQRWKANQVASSVIMEAAFTWLRDRQGSVSNVKRLVHGDAGIHNMLIDGDRVTALVDWEFAHAGDAAEDLAYCRGFVRQFMDWDRFVDCYIEAGGPEITSIQMKYWGVWAALRNAVATCLAHSAFVNGQDRDLRVAAIGMNTYPRLLRNLAAAMKGAE